MSFLADEEEEEEDDVDDDKLKEDDLDEDKGVVVDFVVDEGAGDGDDDEERLAIGGEVDVEGEASALTAAANIAFKEDAPPLVLGVNSLVAPLLLLALKEPEGVRVEEEDGVVVDAGDLTPKVFAARIEDDVTKGVETGATAG